MEAGNTLLVIRHAIAEDRDEAAHAGVRDADRALTDKGRQRMQMGAAGLRWLLDGIDLIAASPLVRARQTAAIVGEHFDHAGFAELDALRPGSDPEGVLAWRRTQTRGSCVAVVGHEPDLGGLISYALAGRMQGWFVPLKKGAACLLAFDDRTRAGSARLVWALPPKVLRRLGG